MNRLLAIGFQVAGEWRLEHDALRIAFRQHAEQCNILYAFVGDGEVKYVGVSSQTLRKRMGGYLSPGPTSTTNIRNNHNIRNLLAQNVAVEVYALPDSGLMHYGPFHLNLAAGLEGSIIAMLRPEWNIVANKLMKEQSRDGESELVELQPMELADDTSPTVDSTEMTRVGDAAAASQGTFEFTLGRTYRDKGFFNGGVASDLLLGAGGECIEIFIGDEMEPIRGTINRTSNLNKTPRVFGGRELQQRFQELSESTLMVVEVLSPTSIRIRVVQPAG
ncbi:GIY-YIG nuclease family protein [Burkholderia cepacia]|uniref:GIY-YIG nuclease family protein n=1 Tax=Burkholderia cepacia TaxID=292 RepID=UPI00264D9199|nr:GIY-YIG nuclease family protein [Burkholderia cepacia]MDN7445649.1 GIY-YIG nuclease family protein [Burkholderia cepacia]